LFFLHFSFFTNVPYFHYILLLTSLCLRKEVISDVFHVENVFTTCTVFATHKLLKITLYFANRLNRVSLIIYHGDVTHAHKLRHKMHCIVSLETTTKTHQKGVSEPLKVNTV